MGCGASSLREVGAPQKISESADDKINVSREKEAELKEFARNGMGKNAADSPADAAAGDKERIANRNSKNSLAGNGSKSSSLRMMFNKVGRIQTRDSQTEFASHDQTIIIFDWDDTLMPSSWIRDSPLVDEAGRLRDTAEADPAIQRQLHIFVEQVLCVLALALDLGKVVIVTNARRPWVDMSCRTFLPEARALMRRVPVFYGLELLQAQKSRQRREAPVNLTETKVMAMQQAVTKFYSRYDNQSWKNVVSIGDAFFEHDAIRQVVRERPEYTNDRKCRTKTVKLLDAPTIGGLEVQLKILASWLTKIVEVDDDVSLDFGAKQPMEEQLQTVGKLCDI